MKTRAIPQLATVARFAWDSRRWPVRGSQCPVIWDLRNRRPQPAWCSRFDLVQDYIHSRQKFVALPLRGEWSDQQWPGARVYRSYYPLFPKRIDFADRIRT